MKTNNSKAYKKAVKDLTNSEIVESMYLSDSKTLSSKDQTEFLKKRMELLNGRTKDELIFSNLLQFKYEVETYLELGEFEIEYSFGKCLKRYMQIINKSSKDITDELSIHKTRLSRIINDREESNPTLTYKLEKHSGGLLPALFWWKIITLKKEQEIINNKKERKEAAKKVKSIVKIRGKVYG